LKILQTKSPVELLDYLEIKTYKRIPSELWDENLFFYNKLLRLLSLSVPDELFKKWIMYKILIIDEIEAIALYELDTKILYFIGNEIEILNQLLLYLEKNNNKIRTINTNSNTIASHLFNRSNYQLNYGDKKFYISNKPNKNKTRLNIKPMNKENAHLLWKGVTDAMDEGIIYFGGFLNNELKCCAGISRISKLRTEIIAVKTFSDLDRKKGYASDLCSSLIDIALEKSIVTWTSNYLNIGSIKTAEKLEMINYISLYSFQVN